MPAKLIPIRRPEPSGATLSDAAIVAACGAGDADALAELYDRYAQATARFLSRLTYVDAQEIEDLVQEVFVAAFRSAARFQGGSTVKTWLFGIGANLARHRARSAQRGRAARSEVALQVLTRESTPVSGRPREGNDPESATIAREAVQRLQGGLARLSHPLRVAFVMCHIEKVPGPEAADALGIPVGTLYRRLHQARTKLLDHMDGAWP